MHADCALPPTPQPRRSHPNSQPPVNDGAKQVVLKPADLTPLTALALAELAERAGVPPGVLSVLVGDSKAIGEKMTSSEVVRKVRAVYNNSPTPLTLGLR